MKNFPPDIDPMVFTIAAAITGAISVGDYDDFELNSIGNWIILVGQYILTYASQMQLIEQRIDGNNINVNSRQYKNGGSPYVNNKSSNQNQRYEVDFLIQAVENLQKELEKMKDI